MDVVFPPVKYCTDNGVMIAWAGYEKFRCGQVCDIIDSDFKARWPLGESLPGALLRTDSASIKAKQKLLRKQLQRAAAQNQETKSS